MLNAGMLSRFFRITAYVMFVIGLAGVAIDVATLWYEWNDRLPFPTPLWVGLPLGVLVFIFNKKLGYAAYWSLVYVWAKTFGIPFHFRRRDQEHVNRSLINQAMLIQELHDEQHSVRHLSAAVAFSKRGNSYQAKELERQKKELDLKVDRSFNRFYFLRDVAWAAGYTVGLSIFAYLEEDGIAILRASTAERNRPDRILVFDDPSPSERVWIKTTMRVARRR